MRFIAENLDAVRENCRNRGVEVDLDALVRLDAERRERITEHQSLQEQRNKLAQAMKGRKPSDEERQLGKQLKERDAELEQALARTRDEVLRLQLLVPNMTHPAAPIGRTEDDNRQLRVHGAPPKFAWKALDHLELAARHDLIDFESAAKVAGQKFYFLKNELVLLEQALVRFALDLLRRKGYTLFQTPDLARAEVAAGLGFNPRGAETNIYSIADSDLVLVGTAEITLGGLHQNEILAGESLPRRYCGVSHCFRVEGGAHGRASRGLYRVHQFTKVEMFAITRPEASEAMHEELVGIEEEIYRALEVPFRVVDVCTGDLGAPAYRKFDLEAWMICRGEGGGWGEITSTSNCTDYQARRLAVRFRDGESDRPRFVHMLNGTAVALSRAPIAILENHQQADGSIAIPAALRPYTGFDRIG
ncbi:MAG TPA: serine--tRNA ligase [Myxococcota bacterium]|nr:serine--tRNA ligase [Myxococcota bacterium]